MTTLFHAMGTDVRVLCPTLEAAAEARLAEDVAAVFRAAEARFSRFREESELSRLNRTVGPCPVSAEMFAALARARALFDATNGLFDPAVGAALVAHGYDRSFAPGALDRPRALPAPAAPRPRFSALALDPRGRTADRPAAMHVDLGGLLKGRTVDRARALLPPLGALDAGGDAFLAGSGPDGAGWPVDVEDPRDPERVLLTLRISNAAVATSADNRRSWRLGDGRAHHLVDPRTGAPARGDLAQVTAVAGSAEVADVLAKVIFLAGAAEAPRWLERLGGAGAVLVFRSGRVELAGALDLDEDAVRESATGETYETDAPVRMEARHA